MLRHPMPRTIDLVEADGEHAGSLADLAQEVEWHTSDDKPYRLLVQRTLNALWDDKLAKKESGPWVLGP